MQNYRIVISLPTTSPALAPEPLSSYEPQAKDRDPQPPTQDLPDPYIPRNIFESLPSHTPQPHNDLEEDWHVQQRGKEVQPVNDPADQTPRPKDWRFGPLSIDWIDIPRRKSKKGKKAETSKATTSNMAPKNTNNTPKSGGAQSTSAKRDGLNKTTDSEESRGHKGTVVASFTASASPDIAFGTTNLPKGKIRIFRDTHDPPAKGPIAPSNANAQQSLSIQGEGLTLAVLAVPFFMTPADFLKFVSSAEENIAHLRLIRDVLPNRTIALIKFRSRNAAEEFGAAFNGREFLSTESEICHVVRVLSVDIDVGGSSALSFSLSSLAPAEQTSGATYELPSCPVCLERMDFAVTGLVSVPCSHTFHCACLSKWGDSRCPVCRYSQKFLASHPPNSITRPPFNCSPSDPSIASLTTCGSCESHTNLWICLICGNVGCGRYGRAHAYAHYESTMHLYALELETQRVWDYAGDGYVHRLIQNKTDGKLVELPSASSMTPPAPPIVTTNGHSKGPGPSDTRAAEKIEAIGIEYSYLLSSQLDSQRAFFEEQRAQLEAQIQAEQDVQADLRSQLSDMEKSKTKAEQRIAKMGETHKRLEKELREEKAVSQSLKKNLDVMKAKMEEGEKGRKALEAKVTDLEEQLRDVMFYLQAKDKIEQSGGEGILGEAVGGDVVVAPQPSSSKKKKK